MPRTLIEETATYRRYRVTDAQGAVVGFDTETIPSPEQANEQLLRSRATAALTANATFLAVATPTAAQVATQTQRLTRECSALIRLLLGLLDDATGT